MVDGITNLRKDILEIIKKKEMKTGTKIGQNRDKRMCLYTQENVVYGVFYHRYGLASATFSGLRCYNIAF